MNKAKDFAIKAHGDQKYGSVPYSDHLCEVNSVIHKYKDQFSEEEFSILNTCSWLHDVVEDTNVSILDIEKEFGVEVSQVIHKITDEPGNNRKERKAKTYPKIATSDIAIALKLADRIANVENCIKDKSSLLNMYEKEHLEFKNNLYNKRFIPMWDHLDKLLLGPQ